MRPHGRPHPATTLLSTDGVRPRVRGRPITRRRATLIAALAAVIIAAAVLSVAIGGPADGPGSGPETVAEADLIEPGGEYPLWPYTSSRRSPDGRTLAINVLVYGESDTVRRSLAGGGGVDWEATPPDKRDAEPETPVALAAGEGWSDAHGSTRYTRFGTAADGRWVTESYQLHAGTYLGARYHLRAYEAPDGSYTAVQVHQEYYDWFRLRHTVTDTADAAEAVEDGYIAAGRGDVRRVYYGVDGGGSDGWLSVIELTAVTGSPAPPFPHPVSPVSGAAVLSGVAAAVAVSRSAAGKGSGPDPGTSSDRQGDADGRAAGGDGVAAAVAAAAWRLRAAARDQADAVVLAAALGGVYLGVRTAGVSLEVAYPALPPKLVVAGLYPVLAAGLPLIAARIALRCAPPAALVAAVGGLGAAFVLDLSGLGVVAVPPGLVVHRVAVLGAIGLIAVGRADADRRAVAAGLIGWVVALAVPLVGGV